MSLFGPGQVPAHFEQAVLYCQRFVRHQNWSELLRPLTQHTLEAADVLRRNGASVAIFADHEYSRLPFSEHWVANVLMLSDDVSKVFETLQSNEWVFQPNRAVYKPWVWEFTKGDNMIRMWRGIPGVRNRRLVIANIETCHDGSLRLPPDIAVAALGAEYCFSGHADAPMSLMAGGVEVWHVDDWVRLIIKSYELGLCRSVYVLGNHARRLLGIDIPHHLLVTMRFLPTPVVTRAVYETGRKRILAPISEWLCDWLSWR